MHPILRPFAAILLDLNGTFMFGHDRFGPDQDYLATYREFGGRLLKADDLRMSMDACFAKLDRFYRDSVYYNCFPSVADVLTTLPETDGLPPGELFLIERVIAAHEAGRIPDEYVAAVRTLAETHRLGIVSNIWSRKDRYVAELDRVGLLDQFGAVVFSSDGACMKPSRVLFDQAVAGLGLHPHEIVVVGDSLRCDVGGAAEAGLASVWIDFKGQGVSAGDPRPGWVVRDLCDLAPKASMPV